MVWGFKQADNGLFFDLLACVLHADPFGGFGDNAHVMGNQDQRHVTVGLKPCQQIQDLRLNGLQLRFQIGQFGGGVDLLNVVFNKGDLACKNSLNYITTLWIMTEPLVVLFNLALS